MPPPSVMYGLAAGVSTDRLVVPRSSEPSYPARVARGAEAGLALGGQLEKDLVEGRQVGRCLGEGGNRSDSPEAAAAPYPGLWWRLE